MVGNAIPRIQEFPADGRYWRVDWFGALLSNENIPEEPLIQVVLSPFTVKSLLGEKPKSLVAISATTLDEQRIVAIGSGQLPMVAIGSIWKDGFCQPQMAGEEKVFEGLDIAPSKVQVIPANHSHQGQALIPFSCYRYGKAGVHSKLVAIEQGGDPFKILIPMVELIRFYYAASTDLAHALFSGTFIHNVESVVNLETTGYQPEKKLFLLGLNKDFSDEDGWIIARILNSEIAYQAVGDLHDSILRQSLNRSFIHVESGFPFDGSTDLTVNIKAIPAGDGKWRYLVLRIGHCTGSFPFNDLMIFRANDSRKADPKTDLDDADKKAVGYKNKGAQESAIANVQDKAEADKSLAAMQVSLPTSRFGAIQGKEPQKPDKAQCNYKSNAIGITGFFGDAFSTSDGGYSDTGVSQIKFDQKQQRKKAIPVDFDFYGKAIELFNEREGCVGRVRDLFNKYIPLTGPASRHQWSYLNSSTKERRLIFAADISYKGNWYTLIDFELRASDKCNMGLLFNKTGSYVSSKNLNTILHRLASAEGVWINIESKENEVFMPSIKTLKHTWTDENHFIENILFKIND